jgi:hypothetical protein
MWRSPLHAILAGTGSSIVKFENNDILDYTDRKKGFAALWLSNAGSPGLRHSRRRAGLQWLPAIAMNYISICF